MKPVKHIETKSGMTVNQLIEEMDASGVFGAGRLAKAVNIAEKMISDKDCKVFFGVAGAMVPGGMRKIIIQMLEDGWVDVLVTTGATLTHDLIEALGCSHYQGSAAADDKKLHSDGVDRIYESYMNNDVYEKLEKFCSEVFEKLHSEKGMSISEFLHEFGKYCPKDSILRICHEKNIPLFCPAIADSGIGLQVWNFIQSKKMVAVDAFDDLKEILDIAWTAKRSGIFYVGGGVPKNYIQQAMQFSHAASYGIQITTDRPEPGGSSGAELRESISWGKLSEDAEFVDVICDATIALPLMHAALKERIS
ncbi:MAG: deoxyhypusine synthase [Candidatus Aenigmarchaeota archaeon]|nr:deoxyhypusine synthase [Candidatus Aenigmarchaeota archaeon]